MYKAIYKKEIAKKSNSHSTEMINRLNARFEFWNETAPKERPVIRDRILYFLKLANGSIPNEYTSQEIRSYPSSYSMKAGLIQAIRLSFDVQVDAHIGSMNVPIEKMVDLDAINQFILTCESPKK